MDVARFLIEICRTLLKLAGMPSWSVVGGGATATRLVAGVRNRYSIMAYELQYKYLGNERHSCR